MKYLGASFASAQHSTVSHNAAITNEEVNHCIFNKVERKKKRSANVFQYKYLRSVPEWKN